MPEQRADSDPIRSDEFVDHLVLARSTLDRRSEDRSDPTLIETLRGDPRTRVLRLNGDRALVRNGELELGAPEEGEPRDALWLYLGADPEGTQYLAVVPSGPSPSPDGVDPAWPQDPGWATLREVGTVLGDRDAGLLTTAVALANWHATHTRCPRCGAASEPGSAGWTRRCTEDGSDHYPRTDPAIIVSVVDSSDRILLGHAEAWPTGRFSTLAGFVEPGESIEAAVRREVREESAIRVGEVTYLGSQPWPFPASLMIGCTAVAQTTEIEVDGTEVSEARWFSREELDAALAAGEVLLPPVVSIARRLIERWYGGPITDAGGVWR